MEEKPERAEGRIIGYRSIRLPKKGTRTGGKERMRGEKDIRQEGGLKLAETEDSCFSKG